MPIARCPWRPQRSFRGTNPTDERVAPHIRVLCECAGVCQDERAFSIEGASPKAQEKTIGLWPKPMVCAL